ncbi:uncharacterized protein V1510DRAFT_412221 [Dipodascopsis tothii]|uniref:uncharacterized protein n=1 Tax=Dipodascopsis tothii TaxID=44089 RepID=UPI0034CD8DF4
MPSPPADRRAPRKRKALVPPPRVPPSRSEDPTSLYTEAFEPVAPGAAPNARVVYMCRCGHLFTTQGNINRHLRQLRYDPEHMLYVSPDNYVFSTMHSRGVACPSPPAPAKRPAPDPPAPAPDPRPPPEPRRGSRIHDIINHDPA